MYVETLKGRHTAHPQELCYVFCYQNYYLYFDNVRKEHNEDRIVPWSFVSCEQPPFESKIMSV